MDTGRNRLAAGQKCLNPLVPSGGDADQIRRALHRQALDEDGKYWTSAGVTGGIDMALALVNHWYGKQYTQAVMLDMEYDPKPPVQSGTPQKSDKTFAQLMKEMYDYS